MREPRLAATTEILSVSEYQIALAKQQDYDSGTDALEAISASDMLFLQNPPHLLTRRPSPTTTEFTVSTLPPHLSLSTRLLFAATLCLRIISSVTFLLVLLAKLHTLDLAGGGDVTNALTLAAKVVASSPVVGRLARWAAGRVEWWVFALVGGVGGYAVFRRGYTEESLLVLRGLGIQTSTSSSTYLGGATTRFIPTKQIQDILIHEAFKGFEVKFYLAVVVEGEEELVVVFPNLLPERRILEQVWRGARACLYEPK